MSTWKPSVGLAKAELLVGILEVEARAAGSVITPVFRHRMVEMIAKTLDGDALFSTVHPVDKGAWPRRPESVDLNEPSLVHRTLGNGHHPEDDIDDEAIHAAPIMGRVHEADLPGVIEPASKAPKGKKAKPAKAAGKKRGRPSKAELEARKAAQG